jgi:soluble lytic murein transglycosylase
MSTRTATRSASRPAARSDRSRARKRQVLRRRIALTAGLALVAVALASLVHPVDHAVREIALPLRHEDIIRQQAADKRVDPALIAAVIYTESRFRDQTSRAGAKGLMQLMPGTADYIAHKTGGTRFERADLATPQINISYGTWYLRYLLNRYHGNTVLTLAAYNAGEGKVDEWWRRASERGERFKVADHIPFPETRDYVHRVLTARGEYRRTYARELGL